MSNIKTLKSIVNRVMLPILLLAPVIAGAARPVRDDRPIAAIPTGSGVNEATNLIGTISVVIRWALGFIGIVVFLIFLFAGFEYATAGGDSGKAETATKRGKRILFGFIFQRDKIFSEEKMTWVSLL
jgi:hypothetical protein